LTSMENFYGDRPREIPQSGEGEGEG